MKKILRSLLVLIVVVALATLSGCQKNDINDKKIIVGASVTPHAEILEQTRDYIESKGYELIVKTYDDYIIPNVALSEGELDANYFQHAPYLNSYNESNKTDLVSVLAVHFEPFGLYAGKSTTLTNIPENAKIGIPNDSTNRARALLLLDALGIITVDKTKGLTITKADITNNPHKIEILEFEAAALPSQLPEVDYAVINGNYALSSNIPSSKLLDSESSTGIGAQTYANIIVVQKGNENSEAIKILKEALQQDAIKEYIRSTYNGVVLPIE